MKHVFIKHEDCEDSYCPYCEGNLLHCSVCGGAEASLPTDCPGRRMTEQEENDVMDFRLDFKDGQWQEPVILKFSIISSHQDDPNFVDYILKFSNQKIIRRSIDKNVIEKFLMKQFRKTQGGDRS